MPLAKFVEFPSEPLVRFTTSQVILDGGLTSPPQYHKLEDGINQPVYETYDIRINGKLAWQSGKLAYLTFTEIEESSASIAVNGMISDLCEMCCVIYIDSYSS